MAKERLTSPVGALNSNLRSSNIVIGIDRGFVVGIPEAWAYEYAQLRQAIECATTWRQFREMAPSRYWNQVMRQLEVQAKEMDQVFTEPPGDEPFDAWKDIPLLEDAGWPEWPMQRMLDWMPEDLQKEFGAEQSTHEGNVLFIPEERLEELIDVLRRRGFRCIRSDAAVKAIGSL
jgi:hypothetical protein